MCDPVCLCFIWKKISLYWKKRGYGARGDPIAGKNDNICTYIHSEAHTHTYIQITHTYKNTLTNYHGHGLLSGLRVFTEIK